MGLWIWDTSSAKLQSGELEEDRPDAKTELKQALQDGFREGICVGDTLIESFMKPLKLKTDR